MKAKRFPVTEEHRAKFAGYLAKWQQKLSLADWRIQFAEKPAPATVMARVQVHWSDKLAIVELGRAWKREITDHELERTAVHELAHVALEGLKRAVASEDDDAIDAAEHGIVILMETLLVP